MICQCWLCAPQNFQEIIREKERRWNVILIDFHENIGIKWATLLTVRCSQFHVNFDVEHFSSISFICWFVWFGNVWFMFDIFCESKCKVQTKSRVQEMWGGFHLCFFAVYTLSHINHKRIRIVFVPFVRLLSLYSFKTFNLYAHNYRLHMEFRPKTPSTGYGNHNDGILYGYFRHFFFFFLLLIFRFRVRVDTCKSSCKRTCIINNRTIIISAQKLQVAHFYFWFFFFFGFFIDSMGKKCDILFSKNCRIFPFRIRSRSNTAINQSNRLRTRNAAEWWWNRMHFIDLLRWTDLNSCFIEITS